MDAAKRQAIEACGQCGHPERDHQHKTGTSGEDIAVLAALGGPCPRFVVSDAAVIYEKYLAIVDNRQPRWRPGRVGKRNPLCPRCARRHRGDCVIASGPPPGPDAARLGAAKAREALGLTRRDDPGAS
jgi:hypothetical protein